MHNRVVAFAPGRVEILGNHTDYNEGVVLSAAIDCGVTASVHRLLQPQIYQDRLVVRLSGDRSGRTDSSSVLGN